MGKSEVMDLYGATREISGDLKMNDQLKDTCLDMTNHEDESLQFIFEIPFLQNNPRRVVSFHVLVVPNGADIGKAFTFYAGSKCASSQVTECREERIRETSTHELWKITCRCVANCDFIGFKYSSLHKEASPQICELFIAEI